MSFLICSEINITLCSEIVIMKEMRFGCKWLQTEIVEKVILIVRVKLSSYALVMVGRQVPERNIEAMAYLIIMCTLCCIIGVVS